MHDVEDLLHFVRGLPQHKRAADIGLVSFHRATIVDQHDGTLADDLRLARAMRQRGVFSDLHAGKTWKSERLVGGPDQLAELAGGDPVAHGFPGGLIGFDGHAGSQAKQSHLSRALYHSAPGCNRRGAGHGSRRSGFRDAIGEDKRRSLLDSDLAGKEAGFFQTEGRPGIRAFVILPGVDVRARYRSGGDLFPRAILFEARADEESVAARRNDHHEQALAIAPTRAAEIVERLAAGQTNGADLVLHHQLLRALDPGAALCGRDGLRFGAPVLQLGVRIKKALKLQSIYVWHILKVALNK